MELVHSLEFCFEVSFAVWRPCFDIWTPGICCSRTNKRRSASCRSMK